MPRPYHWIRGEGTVKNQRGMGALTYPPSGINVSSDPLAAFNASDNSGTGSSETNPYWNWLFGGGTAPVDPTTGLIGPGITYSPVGASSTSTMGIVAIAGIGLLALLLVKKL
jgi:hypothetical protein